MWSAAWTAEGATSAGWFADTSIAAWSAAAPAGHRALKRGFQPAALLTSLERTWRTFRTNIITAIFYSHLQLRSPARYRSSRKLTVSPSLCEAMPPQVPANPNWSRRPLLVLCAALLERCLGRHVKGWQGAASKYDTCVHCERPPNRRSVQSGDESTGRRQAGWQLSSRIMQTRMLFSPHLCWRGQTKGQPAGSTPQPTAAVLWTLRTLPLQLQSHKKGGLRTYATRVCTWYLRAARQCGAVFAGPAANAASDGRMEAKAES